MLNSRFVCNKAAVIYNHILDNSIDISYVIETKIKIVIFQVLYCPFYFLLIMILHSILVGLFLFVHGGGVVDVLLSLSTVPLTTLLLKQIRFLPLNSLAR